MRKNKKTTDKIRQKKKQNNRWSASTKYISRLFSSELHSFSSFYFFFVLPNSVYNNRIY